MQDTHQGGYPPDNHTAGEWHTFIPRLRKNPTRKDRLLVLHPDGERIIARVGEGIINGKGRIPDEELEANLILISQAPALLKELKNCADYLAELFEEGRENVHVKRADAVIAAATKQPK